MSQQALRVALSFLFVCAFAAGPARAQERLFPRGEQSGVLRGGLTAIGGTNGGFSIVRQDVDGNDATSDSSSEVMTLPSGAEVLYAALMWNQDCILPCTMTGDHAIDTTRSDGGSATIVLPDDSVATVTSSATKAYGTVAAGFTVVGRSAHADVTDLVRSYVGGDTVSGRFAVGNIHPTITGGFRNATWSIFVVYRDPTAPLRALAIDFHAAPLPAVDGATERALTIGGIQLPSQGPVTGDVIVFAADGQASLSVQERIFIDTKDDAQALSNDANPDNGVWNHSISYRGVSSTTALPDPRDFNSGAAGIDLDVFDITGKPTPGATETTLIATTTPAGNANQEYVLLMTLGLSVDVQQPELVVSKEVAGVRHADGSPDPSGIADHGDLIDFVIAIENVGNDDARDIVLTDIATESLVLVDGSVEIDGGAAADASPSDGVAVGSLAVGATRTITYTMQVGPATVGATLENLARLAYAGSSDGGVMFAAETPPTFTPYCGNALPEGETCDDGNDFDVDACRNDCSVNEGPEVCDDGFDNDADGLVDAWDVTDCGPPAPTCTVTAAIPEFTVRQAWASSRTFGAMQALVAGDVDGDGVPEVIACSVTGTDYAYSALVMVSHAGTADVTYTTMTLSDSEKANAGATPAIGDVFLDVPGAEIMVLSMTGRLHVFSATGVHLGASEPIHPALPIRLQGDGIAPPNLADIDEDGKPEIVLGNAVLRVDDQGTTDPGDDAIVIVLPLDTTIPRGNGPQSEHVVLADLLSPADCGGEAVCQGLEMAAGGTVYALDLARGERRVVRRLSDIDATIPTGIDGSTAVADVNGDGSLDIVFGDTRDGGVARDLYIWDPRLMTLHARFADAVKSGACGGATTASTRGMLGVIAITEVYDERESPDDPNLPEILFTTVNAVRAYHVELGQVWELAHSDCSGATGVTAFDFNGDGVREVVINDETQLRIVYGGPAPFPTGVGATRNWAAFSPSGTATLTEHPIVVDVDADGQAEILAVTASTAKSLTGTLRIFESASEPWRPTRTSWNQTGYRVTAIGDNLVVPTIMQDSLAEIPAGSGKRPLNNANTQSQIPEDLRLPPGILAAADIEITGATLLSRDATTGVSACGSDAANFAIALSVDNVGDAPLLAGTPIAIYAADPFTDAAPMLVGQDTTTNDEVIAARGSGTITADFPAPAFTTTEYNLFVVINDTGDGPWPLSAGVATGECVRDSDNMGTVTVTCNACGNGVLELNELCDTGEALGSDPCGCQLDCAYGADDTPCEDGDSCTTNDTCDGDGACVSGASPCPADEGCVDTGTGFQCTNCVTDADCVDTGATPSLCHAFGCLANQRCGEVPTPGALCDDDQFCNGVNVCTADGRCGDGPAPCDGDDVCDETEDRCTDPCGNGVVAGDERCDDGEANGTTPCGCQTDCTYGAANVACSTGAACSVAEVCDGDGACGGGTSPCPADETCVETDSSDNFLCANCAVDDDCTASQPEASTCHRWSCNGARRCEEVPTPGVSCEDTLFCNGSETCDSVGDCTGSAACSDDDVCDEVADTCTDPCGNGVVAGDEACDDGGAIDGDGCSATCALEHGYCRPGTDGCEPCPADGPCPAVVAVCGDGRVAAGDSDGDEAADEACDDGNDDPDDGCAACQVGCGFACTTAEPASTQGVAEPQTSGCQTACGDSIVAGDEECDDGAAEGDDGCSAACRIEPGWLCVAPVVEGPGCESASVCTRACGNGVLDGDEICDAGAANGTTVCGCRVNCEYEHPDVGCDDGLACNGGDSCDGAGSCVHGDNPCGTDACVEDVEGDGYTCITCTGDAECDDGNACTDDQCVEGACAHTASADACDDGVFCNGAGTCGDGMCVEPGNPCDAATEKCDEEARRCIQRCGDGVLDEGEACDGGDGCLPTCELEPEIDGLTAQGGGGCGGGSSGGVGLLFALLGIGAALRRRRGTAT